LSRMYFVPPVKALQPICAETVQNDTVSSDRELIKFQFE
jgi:hypothetical protein